MSSFDLSSSLHPSSPVCLNHHRHPGIVELLADGQVLGIADEGVDPCWRLGYLAGPQEIMKWVNRILSHSVSHATTSVQWAGIEALKGPQDNIKEMVTEYQERRDQLVSGLKEIGINSPLPGGAFYVFPAV
jgi:hypothetical protein